MPPVIITPDEFPKTIFGIHDLEGASFLTQNNCSGWLVHTVKLDSDPPTDYGNYVNAGLRVIVRLNYDYGGTTNGTIPLPAQYDAFATSCGMWVAASKGARIWLIGNEPNLPDEWPQGQPITVQQFAGCYQKCRAAIHSHPGHENDQVIPGGVAPWNPAEGDWVQYFQTLYGLIKGNCDGVSLHTYTHGNTPDKITDESKFGAPYQNDHYNFRTYRDFMNVVPTELRGLPVYITETQTIMDQGPTWTHQNTGWVQAAYGEINAWNQNNNNQPIQALCLFRWKPDGNPQWALQNYSEIQNDLRAAIQKNYQLVLPRAAVSPTQTLEQAALARAQSVPWMPVNDNAALWQYAKAHGLQDQQTDELHFTYNGADYIVQVFNRGIVYVKVGDWGNIHVIPK